MRYPTERRICTPCCGLSVYIFKNSLFLIHINSVSNSSLRWCIFFPLKEDLPQVLYLRNGPLSIRSPHPNPENRLLPPHKCPLVLCHQWLSGSPPSSQLPCPHLCWAFPTSTSPSILISCPLIPFPPPHHSGLAKACGLASIGRNFLLL